MEYKNNPFTLRFLSNEQEKTFQEENLKNNILMVRICAILGGLIFAAFAFLDPWIVAISLESVWLIRFIFCSIVLIFLIFTFTPYYKNHQHSSGSFVIISAGIGIITMIALIDEKGGYLYYAGILVVLMYASFLGLRFIYSLGVNLFLLAAYEFVAIAVKETPLPILLNNSFFMISAIVVCLFCCYLIESSSRKMFMQNQMINKAQKDAEMANIAKSEFLANMSHEIRTPMNSVLGFSDILLSSNLDADQTDYANTIKRSGETLLSLINDILDFSKIESGHLDFEEIDFDLELLAYDVCEMVRPRIGSKPIELLCSIRDNVPSMVKGDPTRFRQVLTNLMGNAPKFTESGEIELSLDIEEEKGDRVKVHAKIRDTGIGVPKDKLSTIFDPFQQADGTTTRKYGGTGLGLSICKKLSILMDGDVWVESEDNRGSTFHFTAWLGKSEDKGAKRISPVTLIGKKILVIDDNQANLKIVRHNLQSVGIEVVALTEGRDVLQALQKSVDGGKPFDLCLCDIQMPDMSGYDVAKEIRNPNSGFQKLPIIALSSEMGPDARRCEEVGFDGFLSKPVNRKKLYQMLERIFGEKEDEGKKDGAKEHKIMTEYSVREEMKHSVCVLLAEDNPVNQKLAKIMLTKGGYQVEVANNGQEAVEKFSSSPEDFDLIFMDIQMPEMDGMEATIMIRKKGFDTIPIVAMTAHAMKGDREKCLEVGMDDYVTKPIKRETVFKMIEKWVFERGKHNFEGIDGKVQIKSEKDEI